MTDKQIEEEIQYKKIVETTDQNGNVVSRTIEEI